MDIIIRSMSDKPIYEQIFDQVKESILTGALMEGDPLPSIRTLAKDLRISVITTKRAYDELERNGYIYTMTGKGSYVAAKDNNLVREEHLRSIEAHMREIARLARPLNLNEDDLLEIYRGVTEEEE